MYKNRLLFISLVIMTITLGACHDELLYPVPSSTLTTANFYQSANDIDMAILGVYSRLQNRKNGDLGYMEMPGDNAYYGTWAEGPPNRNRDNWTSLSTDDGFDSFWSNTYNGIFRANNVLENIDNPINYGSGEKDQYIGEAKFLRALFYFDMVRLFGGVPLIDRPISIEESRNIPRASVAEVYSLIVEDLKDAESKLPEHIAWGRASKGAAAALLAKVYVYLEDWPNARIYLEKLINDFNYELEPDVNDAILKINNSESIFVVTYMQGTFGQSITHNYLPYLGVYGLIQNGGNRCVSWDLLKRFHPDDSRKDAWIEEWWKGWTAQPEDEPIFWPYPTKYLDPARVDFSYHVWSGIDIPVIRLADMILLYAETLYELNQPELALIQLNGIRERAFNGTSHNYTLADVPNRNAWIEKLHLERRFELCFENERWFDMTRSGLFMEITEYETFNDGAGNIQVKYQDPQPWKRYFPIPQSQIDQYESGIIVQNEGYD